MVICEVVVGGKRNLLIGAYLLSSTMYHLSELEEDLTRFRDQDPIVLGDLNANIQDHNTRSQHVADLLMEIGMVHLLHHSDNAGTSDTEKHVLRCGKEYSCGQDVTTSWGKIGAASKWWE